MKKDGVPEYTGPKYLVMRLESCSIHEFHTARDAAIFMWARAASHYAIFKYVPFEGGSISDLKKKLTETTTDGVQEE